MKATRKMKLKELERKFRNIYLEDDATETGGISFIGETLDNFLNEVEMPYDSPLEEINKALSECGIKPIHF